MNRNVWWVTLAAGVCATTAQAGMFDGLRELRGAIAETTATVREVQGVNREMQGLAGSSGGVAPGDVLVGKTGSVRVYREPSKSSRALGQASQMVYTGNDANGFYSVSIDDGDGWVQKLVVRPR